MTRGIAILKRADRQLEWMREDEDDERCTQGNRQSDGEGAGVAMGTTELVLEQALLQVPLGRGEGRAVAAFCRSAMALHTAILRVPFSRISRELSHGITLPFVMNT